MNCRDFDVIVDELACEALMEAATREAGLGHAATCAACAARLSDARGVGDALWVASEAEVEEAPARIKHALLAAFAEQQRAAATPAPVFELPRRRVSRWWLAGAAAAVAALLLLSLTLAPLTRPGAPQQAPTAAGNDAASLPAVPAPLTKDLNEQPPAPVEVAQVRAAKRFASRSRNSSKVTRRGAVGKADAVGQNTGSDYLPLTYLASATAIESGTVVRVELSRSALARLGVPVSVERADELMKAEVVLGDDGVARAIRLVR